MKYKKAPITEAVIELRFARPFAKSVIETAARRLRDEYFYQDPENGMSLKFDTATGKTEVQTDWEGIKLSSMDRVDTIFFRTVSFICSRLAPYTGWEDFMPRTVRAWETWKRVAGTIELSRVGVRYINRIDVPVENDAPVRVENYLSVSPQSPEDLPPMSGYAMQIVRPLGFDDCGLTMNSSTVVPPLIGFASFVLDIDIFRETNLPRRDEELWSLLNRIREHKNRIFESCITNRARALFQ
jgi:uncharacterized protein (TIGR04255 family)